MNEADRRAREPDVVGSAIGRAAASVAEEIQGTSIAPLSGKLTTRRTILHTRASSSFFKAALSSSHHFLTVFPPRNSRFNDLNAKPAYLSFSRESMEIRQQASFLMSSFLPARKNRQWGGESECNVILDHVMCETTVAINTLGCCV